MACAYPLWADSEEKNNFVKLSRLLIDGGTVALRHVFDSIHPPATLAAFLNTNRGVIEKQLYPPIPVGVRRPVIMKRVLFKEQWETLYPPIGSPPPSSQQFDISLLIVLLRNTFICGLARPSTGWNDLPASTDTSKEANLARIKYYRNNVYGHVKTTAIECTAFQRYWNEISKAILSLGGVTQSEIEELKSKEFGTIDYTSLLEQWWKSDVDVAMEVNEMAQQIQILSSQIAELKTVVEKKNSGPDLNIHIDCAGTTSTSGHAEPVSKPSYCEEVMHDIVTAYQKKINSSVEETHKPGETHRGIPLRRLIDNVTLLDQLAQCLDREMKSVNNWSHLCFALDIEQNNSEKFNLYLEQSPTISLFKYLSTTKPDLSIGQLTVALSEIGRNDICLFVSQLAGDDSVSKEVTFSSSDVLDKIAQKLDIAKKPLGNWEELAGKLGVLRGIYQKFEMYSSYSPTVLLLRHIYITYEEAVTVEQVMDALEVMDRKDVLQLLRDQNFQGNQMFKEVVKLDSDVCNNMADYLNGEITGTKGWKRFGDLLGVKTEILNDLEPPKEKAFHSPTKKMLTWLASERPHGMTVEELMVSLEKIKRGDAVELIINSLYTDPANPCSTGESTSAVLSIPATDSDPPGHIH